MNKRNNNLKIILVLIFLTAVYAPMGVYFSYAQDSSTATKASVIEERIRQDVEPENISILTEETLSQPELEDQREALALDTEDVSKKVYIEKFILSGVLQFTGKDFSEFLSQYKNRYLNLNDLNKIVEYIQNFYRYNGYITSFVYIPVQEIRDKTVEIRVVEGAIGQITIEGGKYFDKERIRKQLNIREGDAILYRDLLKQLIKLNQHPDRTVKAMLSPGERLETTDIIVKLEDRNPNHMFVEYNNRGTKYTGKSRFNVGYANNNLFGVEDVLSLRYQKSNDELNGASIDYNLPINYKGTRLGGYLSFVDVAIGREFAALNAEGDAKTGGLYINHSLADKAALRSSLMGGIDIKRSENTLLGNTESEDKLTVVKTGISLGLDDQFGRNSLSSQIHAGIEDFLGSMKSGDSNASRLNGDPDFMKYTMNFTRQQYLPLSSYLLLMSKGQWTSGKMLSSEQFYVGGADTVRGYPELEYAGDYGYNLRAELRTPLALFYKIIKSPENDRFFLKERIQLVYFMDYAKAYLRDPLVGEIKDKSLAGAGLGLRVNPWDDFSFGLDWGFPLEDDPSDGSESTVHIWSRYDLF